MNNPNTAFGASLKRLRRGLGLTQEEFAVKADVSARTLVGIENAHRGVSLRTAAVLAEAAGSDITSMIAGDAERAFARGESGRQIQGASDAR